MTQYAAGRDKLMFAFQLHQTFLKNIKLNSLHHKNITTEKEKSVRSIMVEPVSIILDKNKIQTNFNDS